MSNVLQLPPPYPLRRLEALGSAGFYLDAGNWVAAQAVLDVSRGAAQTVVLVGSPGVGKTELLRHAVDWFRNDIRWTSGAALHPKASYHPARIEAGAPVMFLEGLHSMSATGQRLVEAFLEEPHHTLVATSHVAIGDLAFSLGLRAKMGAAFDIQRPTRETLTKIASREEKRQRGWRPGFELPPEAVRVALSRIGNPRGVVELIWRLAAAYEATGRQPTAQAVIEIIEHADVGLFSRQPKIQDIIRATSMATGFSTLDLTAHRRTRLVVRARHAAIWTARQLTQCSLPQIGRYFGGRDHTSVLHAFRKVDAERGVDVELGDLLGRIQTIAREMVAI